MNILWQIICLRRSLVVRNQVVFFRNGIIYYLVYRYTFHHKYVLLLTSNTEYK